MTQNITTRQYFRTISILYFALPFFMVVLGLAVYFLTQTDLDEAAAKLFQYALLFLIPAGWVAGYFVSKNLFNFSGQPLPLRDKLMKYQGVMLIRAAFLEAPGLLAGVGALNTGDHSLLLFIAVEVVAFVIQRPTPRSVVNDLSLDGPEKYSLEDPEAVLYQV